MNQTEFNENIDDMSKEITTLTEKVNEISEHKAYILRIKTALEQAYNAKVLELTDMYKNFWTSFTDKSMVTKMIEDKDKEIKSLRDANQSLMGINLELQQEINRNLNGLG